MSFSKDIQTKKKLRVSEWRRVEEKIANLERRVSHISEVLDSSYTQRNNNTANIQKLEKRNATINEFWGYTGVSILVVLALVGIACIIRSLL